MRVLVVRHGKAERDAPSGRDEDRALAPRGGRQAEWLARRLQDRDDRPALLLASRYDRARSTAELLARVLGLTPILVRELECDRAVSDAVGLIARHGPGPLALVGHNPQLEGLVSAIALGPGARGFTLRTGQCAVLEVDPREPLVGGRLVESLRMDDED